jgi:hypothetical protein
MRKPEQKLWDRLSVIMKGRWRADRIESETARDVPDIYFMLFDQGPRNPSITGWIELKQIKNWHQYRSHVTQVPHFTYGQKKWLREHWEAGENCWLLLQVEKTNEILFFSGHKAQFVGDCTQGTLYTHAAAVFRGGLPTADYIRGILETHKGEL